MMDLTILACIFVALLLLVVAAILWGSIAQARFRRELPRQLDEQMQTHHRAVLSDLHDGLTKQSDRILGS